MPPCPTADVLVLDDNSPDGTGQVADELVAADPQVHVLHRPGKQGLGNAYLAGFAWALEQGYGAIVEMDADGSHQPEQLPALLAALPDADLVIGVALGARRAAWSTGRCTARRSASAANLYTRALLGMPVHDATAGYRVYRASALQTIGLDHVASQGYCFQVDLTQRAVRLGLRVVEVPITFVEREIGDSKMSGDIMRESLHRITSWGLAHRADQVRRLGRTGAHVAPAVGRTPYARRRRPRWLAVVFVLLLVVPVLEIAAIIAVGKVIGGWQTLRPAAGRVGPRRLAGPARGCPRLEGADARPSTPARCPAGSSPTRPSCSWAAPCCSPRGSSPTSSASSSSCPSPGPIARTLLEAVVAKRLLGGRLRRPRARAVRWRRGAAAQRAGRHRGRSPLAARHAAYRA